MYLVEPNENCQLEEIRPRHVECDIVYTRQDTETTRVSADRGTCEEIVAHTHTHTRTHAHTQECYSAIRREILLFATLWTDLESIMLRKISQTEKGRYMISLMYSI